MTSQSIARPRRRSGQLGERSMRTVVVIVAIAIVAWLTLVFGSALARSDTVRREAEVARAEIAALEARVAAGRAEIALIQTEAFLNLEARAYGMGKAGEVAFALTPDAPPPPVIVPLGDDAPPAVVASPLEEWLALLFG